MKTYKLNKRPIIVVAFILLLSICLLLFFKNEFTNNEAPKKATFVRVNVGGNLHYE